MKAQGFRRTQHHGIGGVGSTLNEQAWRVRIAGIGRRDCEVFGRSGHEISDCGRHDECITDRDCERIEGSSARGAVRADRAANGETLVAGEGQGGAREHASGSFAARVEKDTRFELCWRRGSLVAFRLLAWLGATAEELNAELLAEANGSASGSGRSWLAPSRDGHGELTLIRAVCGGVDPKEAWDDVHAATEKVMLRRFGGVFCSCDCLEALAGKALV